MSDRASLIAEQRERIREIDRLLERMTSERARAGLLQSREDALRLIKQAQDDMDMS